jgi:peptide/nickel transport system permease protein
VTTSGPLSTGLGALDTPEIPEELPPVRELGNRTRPQRRSWPRAVTSYAVTVLLLVTLNFLLPRAMPGDPVEAMLSLGTSNPVELDTRQRLEEYYGLDRPLSAQYRSYLGNLARGDLGLSIRHNAPVTGLLLARLPWTVLLVSSAMAVAALVGLVAGIHSGWRRASLADRGLLAGFMAASSIPPFFLGSVAVFVFAVKLGWFPLAGARTSFASTSGVLAQVVDVAHHLVLPASVLALTFLLTLYLVMRSTMVSELGSDYLLLGRAKGLRERRLKYHYAARNALLPVVSELALLLGVAVPVAIFVEEVFAYPGLGRLLAESAFARDYPTMQGCFLLLSLLVVALNLLADLLNTRLDPRTRE